MLAYRAAWALAGPLVGPWLAWRARRGKEDPRRLGERAGRASLPRPAGALCWIHAASVGEARSVAPLVERLARRPRTSVLLTTVTRTSARALEGALPERAFHQFAPLDRPAAVARFLDHWRPDLAVRVESEIWPATLDALARAGVPRAIVQGRLSAATARRWRLLGGTLRRLLAGFDPVIAQGSDDVRRFAALGVANVRGPLNLKADAGPPAADPAEEAALRKALGNRPRWLAASTHPGEEEAALAAHRHAAARIPGLLTVLLPRHPDRGAEVEALARADGLRVRRRTRDGAPGDADAYVADTLGETGLFYRLCPVAFVGGTLAPRGGHNLLEPAGLGRAVLHGPDVANVRDVARALEAAGGSREVADAESLGAALLALLGDPAAAARMGEAAGRVARAAAGAADRVEELLLPALRRAEERRARA